jgi:ABC-type phosphate transport system ATPase subunit
MSEMIIKDSIYEDILYIPRNDWIIYNNETLKLIVENALTEIDLSRQLKEIIEHDFLGKRLFL